MHNQELLDVSWLRQAFRGARQATQLYISSRNQYRRLLMSGSSACLVRNEANYWNFGSYRSPANSDFMWYSYASGATNDGSKTPGGNNSLSRGVLAL